MRLVLIQVLTCAWLSHTVHSSIPNTRDEIPRRTRIDLELTKRHPGLNRTGLALKNRT